MTSKTTPENQQFFRKTILKFYKQHKRVLPWRQTTDPYKILVSELMLQQTQVPRVIEKYNAFIEIFPTPKLLVDAPLSKVLMLWQGLGYNRRAKYLKEAAKVFIDNQAPSFEELLAQKGIGEYTAAAVCAFAYNQKIAAIDVNVHRVFDRYFGAATNNFIENTVPTNSRDWHNALMDFGSLICTKRSPPCESCPLAKTCHALQNNTFKNEKSATQPKFEGSERWHRGQVLKAVLHGEDSVETIWQSLEKKYRSEDRFTKAIQQLCKEGMLNSSGQRLFPAKG